jgi:hypothetical protein
MEEDYCIKYVIVSLISKLRLWVINWSLWYEQWMSNFCRSQKLLPPWKVDSRRHISIILQDVIYSGCCEFLASHTYHSPESSNEPRHLCQYCPRNSHPRFGMAAMILEEHLVG